MPSHFEDHGQDVDDLVALAADRGVALTRERAYRAWIRHSRSMEAGFSGFSSEGGDGDLAFEILTGELPRLEAEDADLLRAESGCVDLLHGHAEAEGLGLTRGDVARIWADHSATLGKAWVRADGADLDAVLSPHRVEASAPRRRW